MAPGSAASHRSVVVQAGDFQTRATPSPHTHTFIFAGGGTGGHLYPGIAIARELARRTGGSARSLFVCSNRPLDAEILTKEALEFVPLGASPVSIRPRGLLRFLRSWGRSVRESRSLIRSEAERLRGARAGSGRDPVHVVAMGGFVAAPFVQAARVERVGITLVNLDAIPGKANRLIARRAQQIFTAAALAPGAIPSSRLAGWQAVPPIVRPEAMPPHGMSRSDCRAALGLDPAAPTLLVTGGSQGARSINQLLLAMVDPHRAGSPPTTSPAPLPGPLLRNSGPDGRWQVLHQCGKDDAELLRRAYHHAGLAAVVEPFVTRMGLWWGAADLAISRAGAGSVAEAWANHVPTVFLPYPYHRDLHQKHNTRVLVDAGGAVLAYDTLDAARTLAELSPVLSGLLQSPTTRQAMQAALERLGPACGAERIAQALLQQTPK